MEEADALFVLLLAMGARAQQAAVFSTLDQGARQTTMSRPSLVPLMLAKKQKKKKKQGAKKLELDKIRDQPRPPGDNQPLWPIRDDQPLMATPPTEVNQPSSEKQALLNAFE